MRTTELDARRVRAAKNQALFRVVNEQIVKLNASRSVFDEIEAMRSIDFICECADAECAERVPLRRARYEEIRARHDCFFVRTGHELAEVEEIVDQGDDYVVVRKVGAGTRVTEALDPRRHAPRTAGRPSS